MFSCNDHPIPSSTFLSNILERKRKGKDLNLFPAKKMLCDFWLAHASPWSSLAEKLNSSHRHTQKNSSGIFRLKAQINLWCNCTVFLSFLLIPATWDANILVFLPGITQPLSWISKMALSWSCYYCSLWWLTPFWCLWDDALLRLATAQLSQQAEAPSRRNQFPPHSLSPCTGLAFQQTKTIGRKTMHE